MTKGVQKVKVKKNDQVIVLSGGDSGKRGRVLEVFPDKHKVRVEGVAMVKRHQKADPRRNIGAGIEEKERLIDISNVKVVCPSCKRPMRVARDVTTDGKHTRICRKCGTNLGE
ncbi:MAG TPA: 50S ribosomal protein L24 [Blastocatellia bacterium]|nr:50S ribosomal protein L24 [Blastocatellia bacterium]